MKDRGIRSVLSVYQIGAGVGGFWVLFGSGQFHANGPLLIRSLLTALLTVYCALLATAGVLLGRGRPSGASLTAVAQGCQIPVILTNTITYVISTPASLVLSVTSHLDLGLELNIAAQLQISTHHQPDVPLVGVNLVALAWLYLVKSRLAKLPV